MGVHSFDKLGAKMGVHSFFWQRVRAVRHTKNMGAINGLEYSFKVLLVGLTNPKLRQYENSITGITQIIVV